MKFKAILPIFLFSLLLSSCTSVVKEKYPDGTLKSEVTMKNGRKNGPAKYFFPSGMIELSVIYVDNQLDGPYEKFNARGIRTERTLYSAGMKNGESKTYSDDGKLHTSAIFVNDTIHGPYTEFHPNGQTKVSGFYNHGLYDGKWEYLNSDGTRVGYAEFKNGTGKQYALHYASKRIKTEISYINNEKDGAEIWYDTKGQIERKIYYTKGKIISNP